VTLEGDVEWNYQKERAETAVRRVKGIRGITNFVMVKPRVEPEDVKRRSRKRSSASAEIDANRITVGRKRHRGDSQGHCALLGEREEAERAAWQAPGVRRVDNRITIAY